ncbi:hypothetical protein GQX73_g1091 [Xylaria multiplex]|uniref:BRCT domain-containing protein n=1 Tax=Xylaria multiplex TaxID=323545 RepID=A0A7C8J7A7_9PEZI|nr:hypothetical protein GQX73_g1091 [Xylaria multiplex]
MLRSPPTSDHVVDDTTEVDLLGQHNTPNSSRPFHGLVLCCTSIEADLRSEIAQRTADMGGVHKYDLTPDVTHLIVGDYNTAKYRHVAKERPDIKPMAAGWVDAVRRLWVEDQDIDFAELESLWKLKTFESGGGIPSSSNPAERERQRLVCCLTGFEDSNVRAMIEDTVKANGGEYVADLSRRVTHLIVSKPEGKKYGAARRWDIRCISIEWLHDSVERGMILNEECYDPTLPSEERGNGAWSREALRRISLGKRAREGSDLSAEVGRRKLRKSASMRMNSQSNNIWGDILNQSAGDLSRADNAQRESNTPPVTTDQATTATKTPQAVAQPVMRLGDNTWPALRKGVFSGCRFFVHGFPESKEQILLNFLTSHGAQLSSSVDDVASSNHAEPAEQRYLLVPQTSQPDSHPRLPDGVHIITEFFIERCIHNKTLFSPRDHVWGQPFPRFPIDGFPNLTICTAGFVNEQLNQIEKTVNQLGATYSEKLNRQITLLICPDLGSLREQKRDLAIYHDIPIVNVEWLWQCITTGYLVPWEKFQFEELTRRLGSIRANLKRKEEDKKKGRETLNRSRSEPVLKKPPVVRPVLAPPPRAGVDMTAFDSDLPNANCETSSVQRQETNESIYETAATHLPQLDDAFASAPLSETTASNLNKSTSPPKQTQANQTLKCFPIEGEVGDSEAGEESDATTRTTLKEPGVETEHKHKAQQMKDLERLELSKRLNSLMANENTAQGGSTHTGPLPRPARRKRQILGRATSNVSVASSASADSAPASGPKMRQLGSAQPVSGGSEFDKFLEPVGEIGPADAEHLPPSTQLQYDIPEARRQRDFVLEKMKRNGKQSSSEAKSTSQSNRQVESQSLEKIRLSDLDPPTQGGGRVMGATRRSTRRQGR